LLIVEAARRLEDSRPKKILVRGTPHGTFGQQNNKNGDQIFLKPTYDRDCDHFTLTFSLKMFPHFDYLIALFHDGLQATTTKLSPGIHPEQEKV
jgi:hypothetical protein